MIFNYEALGKAPDLKLENLGMSQGFPIDQLSDLG